MENININGKQAIKSVKGNSQIADKRPYFNNF